MLGAAAAECDAIDTPSDPKEIASFLSVSSRLVEAAAYGAAQHGRTSVVTDLILISGRLDAYAREMRERSAGLAPGPRGPRVRCRSARP